jgi:hypothetical protein
VPFLVMLPVASTRKTAPAGTLERLDELIELGVLERDELMELLIELGVLERDELIRLLIELGVLERELDTDELTTLDELAQAVTP